nr:response regulator transcription factor [Zavarzinella formosa]
MTNQSFPIHQPAASGILLVEDDLLVADAVAGGLTEEGMSVTVARDGLTGEELLARDEWKLVILDWWLPGRDGLGLLENLRRRGSAIPVLFLTARDAVADRVRVLNAGADDYLCKPFAFDELLARVRALVRRSVKSETIRLEFQDVSADLIARKAWRAGHALELGAKSHELLMYFLRHPGELLTRRQLTEDVWHEPYHPASRTIDVHLVELRRELEAYGPRLIHTCRGHGYRLAVHPSE